jgi:hypothetical protein
MEPLKGKVPLALGVENVKNLNSLQVIYAERYVFSMEPASGPAAENEHRLLIDG